MKIRLVLIELFPADRQTDRQADMVKLIVVFCNFRTHLKNQNMDFENKFATFFGSGCKHQTNFLL